jgi:hypothetical protein
MHPEVLAKADVYPPAPHRVRLDGWELHIAPRATLIPAEGRCVYGILAQLTHQEIDKLYTKDWVGFGTYLPEAVIVTAAAGRHVPALCYVAWQTEGGKPTKEYRQTMVEVAQRFSFPEAYVRHMQSFA